MPFATQDIIGILTDNLRLRKSVLPIPRKNAVRWARGLDLRHGGDTVIYTGLMYQLIPYIEGLVEAEKKLADSRLAGMTALGRKVNRLLNISRFMARPSAELRATYDQVPADVARLLKKAGVDFGYLYGDDLYTGALTYDLGSDDAVIEHAKRVHAVLRKHGVKTLITIDPHTTNMLRSVYPKLLPDFDIQVKTYLEVLDEAVAAGRLAAPAATPGVSSEAPGGAALGELAVHDPCVFARYEGIVDEPRRLLAAAGATIKEPEKSGRMTWCCGGPVESLYPEKAHANAVKRAAQLAEASPHIVTMCPLCLVNLRGAAAPGTTFNDISHYLTRAFVA